MQTTTIIGLEVHVQLKTLSKLFCGCTTAFAPDEPNTQTCPVCLGLPGALPVMNAEAFRLAVKTALALNCDISAFTKWDRKQYYYPDLPKAYQISQYDLPFSHDGWVEIEVGEDSNAPRKIGIIRAHLEEDAGKNMHDESGRGGDSKVDLNRCGTPLVEIVSEPDLRSPAEARQFLEELRLLLTYLEVSDCNMQEGSLRCDANVNLHIHTEDGHQFATPICEVKNLNSFRAVEAAIAFEEERQLAEWQKTGRKLGDPGVTKETRGWDANRNLTFAQRGKEEASDYRYFPDPDLVPIEVDPNWLEELRSGLIEFPADRRKRIEVTYGISDYDAGVIIDQGHEFVDYFETVAKECGDGKQAANWVTQDVQRELKERHLSIADFPIGPGELATLLKKIQQGELTVAGGREVFQDLLNQPKQHDVSDNLNLSQSVRVEIDRIIEARGLKVVSDTGALQSAVDTAVAANPKAVEDFQNGKQQAVGKMIGDVMRSVKGADPKTVRAMLIERMQS